LGIVTGLWGESAAVGLVWGWIEGYGNRAGRGIRFGIDPGLWGESGPVGVVWGLIQSYGVRVGQ